MRVCRRAFIGAVSATLVDLAAGSTMAGDAPVVLAAGAGSLHLSGADATSVFAYNASVPGPLLRVKHGTPLRVRLDNKLAQPTTLAWHGVRIANAMDGVAGLTQAPVSPGGSFTYEFTPPDAGLFWYHPHVWPQTAEQIDRGLYGALIVDEASPPDVDHDLLVVIDDWMLDARSQIAGGVLDPATALHDGRVGPLVTVNGKAIPAASEVRPGARLRLRLLNACSARIAVVGIVGMQATVIAIDGQPSEIFQPARATIPIGPGSRFEAMVDGPTQAGMAASLVLRGDQGQDRPLMVFTATGASASTRPPVVKLPGNPLLPTRIPLEKSLRRDLVLGGGAPAVSATVRPTAAGLKPYWTINGQASDGVSGKPLFAIKRGGTVTLTFVNGTAFPQQMHIHGHVWRLLHDLDDGWDPYWRDSVLLAPGKTKHVAFIADNPGKWALASAMPERQVTGMATWFEVT